MLSNKLYLFNVLLILTFNVSAAFMSLNAGYDQFATQKMMDNNASFKGLNYQAEFGAQMRHTIITVYIKKSDLTAKLKHDDQEYTTAAEHLSYGLKASFKVTKNNYISFGYNISNIENNFSGFSNYNSAGIKKAYDLRDQQRTNGMLIGVGKNFYKKRGYSLFGEYNYIDHGNLDAKTHVLYFGFRFRTKINI